MEMERIRILLVEDNAGDARLVQEMLEERGSAQFKLTHATRLKMAINHINEEDYEIILLDLGLPDSYGINTFQKMNEVASAVPIIVFSALGDESVVVKALQEGAQDYLVKGQVDSNLLFRAIRYAIERKRADIKIRHLNMVLKAIRNVNQLITTERDKNKLLKEICATLVNTQGYSSAWIMILEKDGVISQFEHAGDKKLREIPDLFKKGQSPNCVKEALEGPNIVYIDDTFLKCQDCPIGKNGGCTKTMIKKLAVHDRVYGLLSTSIPPLLDVSDEEFSLFDEVCGDLAHALFVMEMVMDKKRSYDELLLSEEKFRTLFDSASDAIFIHDEAGKMLEVNAVACRRLGLSREELLQITPMDFDTPENASIYGTRTAELKNKGQIIFETIHMAKDGRRIPTEINAQMIEFHGRPAILSVARDITERKRNEEQAKQRARDEIYGFLASALPVFASNLPTQVRDTFVIGFGERFENIMRPRFQEAVEDCRHWEEVSGAGFHGGHVPIENYVDWIAELFSNFGISVKKGITNNKAFLEMLDCPWSAEAKGNPIFCLLCRTMVIRFASWTDPQANANQISSIAAGAKNCRFELSVPSKNTRVIPDKDVKNC